MEERQWEEERQMLKGQLDRSVVYRHLTLCIPASLILNNYSLYSTPTFAQLTEAVNTTIPLLKKQIRRSQQAKAAFIKANLCLIATAAHQTIQRNSPKSASKMLVKRKSLA
eukprot:13448118-Ditylum_brightwellii.AAC.1